MNVNDRYKLSAYDVHPRQSFKGFQLSPDGEWFSFLYQHDVETRKKGEGETFTEEPVSDICVMPSQGGCHQFVTNSRDINRPAAWSPNGTDVPLSQFESFIERASRAGVKIEHKRYPSEPHNPKDWGNRQNRLDSIASFFRKHLQEWDLSRNPSGGQVL